MNSYMGAGHSGGLGPNGVIATPILPDPPLRGRVRSCPPHHPRVPSSPAAKTIDPDEARRQRGLAIAAVTRIAQKNGLWIVPSQTGNG